MTQYTIHTDAQRERIITDLRRLPLEKPYMLKIERAKEKRRDAQNRLYWVWMAALENETGHTKDELHEYFKRRFLGAEIKHVFGKEVEIANSTTDLTVGEFAEYLTKIQVICAEMGYLLPADINYELALHGRSGSTSGNRGPLCNKSGALPTGTLSDARGAA